HDAPGANVDVSHFTIAHLSVRQTDVRTRGMNQRVRKFLQQRVIGWLTGQRDRIAFALRAESPSIQHRQYNWLRSFCHSPKEYTPYIRAVIQPTPPLCLTPFRTLFNATTRLPIGAHL